MSALLVLVVRTRIASAQTATSSPPPGGDVDSANSASPIEAPVAAPLARPTVRVSVVSIGTPGEASFIPFEYGLPRDTIINYYCHTPCNVPLYPGRYRLVVRSPAGRFDRTVDVQQDVQYFVTPRTSIALGLGLLLPGAALTAVGTSLLITGASAAATPCSYCVPFDVTPYVFTGTVFTVAGVALLAAGGYFLRGTGGAVRTAPDGSPLASDRSRVHWRAAMIPLVEGGAFASAALSL